MNPNLGERACRGPLPLKQIRNHSRVRTRLVKPLRERANGGKVILDGRSGVALG